MSKKKRKTEKGDEDKSGCEVAGNAEARRTGKGQGEATDKSKSKGKGKGKGNGKGIGKGKGKGKGKSSAALQVLMRVHREQKKALKVGGLMERSQWLHPSF
jgi:hypothetical protein